MRDFWANVTFLGFMLIVLWIMVLYFKNDDHR